MSGEAPFRTHDDGLLIFLRVTPRADRDALEGMEHREGDICRLKLRVRAVADKGAANKAVIALLAKLLGTPKSALSLTAGSTDRNKTVAVRGEAAALAGRIRALLEARS